MAEYIDFKSYTFKMKGYYKVFASCQAGGGELPRMWYLLKFEIISSQASIVNLQNNPGILNSSSSYL